MPIKKKARSRISVAEYLTIQIALSGKSQKDIARELNYDNPNIITMFKQGKTKVPLNKVPRFAEVLGVHPVHFLRIAMLEYSPEIWETIEQVIGQSVVSENEMEILRIIRDTAEGIDVAPVDSDDKMELATLVTKWRERDKSLAAAALHILE